MMIKSQRILKDYQWNKWWQNWANWGINNVFVIQAENIKNVIIIYIKELNNKKMKIEEKELNKIDNIINDEFFNLNMEH